jgi:serine/threonine protein kinase
MLKCRECGEIVNPEDVYCAYCGIRLKESVPFTSDEPAAMSEPEAIQESSTPESEIALKYHAAECELTQESFIPESALPQQKITGTVDSPRPFSKEEHLSEILGEVPTPRILKPKEPIPELEKLFEPEKIELQAPKTEEVEVPEIEKPEKVLTESAQEKREPIEEHVVERTDFMNLEDTLPYTPEDLKREKLLGAEKPKSFPAYDEIKDKVQEKMIPLQEDLVSQKASQEEQALQKKEEVEAGKIIEEKTEKGIAEGKKIEVVEETNIEERKAREAIEREAEGRKEAVSSAISGQRKGKLTLLQEGTVLANRYEIVKKIGGGGMGAVYLAKDRNLGGALRAVKEMIQSYVDEEKQEKAVNDFRREALLLSSLEHPSIPTIYDYFHDEREGRFYLVMKYISGSDLAAKLRSSPEGRIEEKIVVQWAIQITDVLDYLHNHQPPVIYRDLKPSNIMVESNTGKVMLIDFGIARWVHREEKGVTAVGTMGYAPPELFSGHAEPRSDIYSLGATMFHLLTGADPQNNPLLIFDFSKNPRPRQINPTLSDQIEQIVMRAVEYKSERRFSSAREMHDALVQHLQNLEFGKVSFGRKSISAKIAQKHIFCAFCGKKILAIDVYCPFCGARQAPRASAETPVEKELQQTISIPKEKARLYVINTEEASVPFFDIEKDSVLVGRRDPLSHIYPDIDLTKYDPQTKISRRHARIWREGGKFMIEDLGSSNGTVLIKITNEVMRLLPKQPKLLSSGDKIKLGDTILRFVIS